MDLLYTRYSNPLEFMRLYIENGRFGEFVENIISIDNKRKIEEAEAENEKKFWDMYIHSFSDKSFNDWKAEVIKNSNNKKQPESLSMSSDQVDDVIEKSRSILNGFNPN